MLWDIEAAIAEALADAAVFVAKVLDFGAHLLRQLAHLRDRLVEKVAELGCALVGLHRGDTGFDEVHTTLTAFLTAVTAPLDLLFDVLERVLRWVADRLRDASTGLGAAMDMRRNLRSYIAGLDLPSFPTLSLRLPPEIWGGFPPALVDKRIRIGVGQIVQAVADLVLGGDVGEGVKQAESDAAAAADLEAKATALQAARDAELTKKSQLEAVLVKRRCADPAAARVGIEVGNRASVQSTEGDDFVEVGDGAIVSIRLEGAPPAFDGTQVSVSVGNVGGVEPLDRSGWRQVQGTWYWRGVIKVVEPSLTSRRLPFVTQIRAQDLIPRHLLLDIELIDIDTLPSEPEDILAGPPRWGSPRPLPDPSPELLPSRTPNLGRSLPPVRPDRGPRLADALPSARPISTPLVPRAHTAGNVSGGMGSDAAPAPKVRGFALGAADARFMTMIPDAYRDRLLTGRTPVSGDSAADIGQYPNLTIHPGVTTIVAVFADGFDDDEVEFHDRRRAHANVIAILANGEGDE
ncbi:MAG TPA: hypothetical protein VLA19_09220 [Herpetosiphonaceae bacterium]|nr:hypothetical protein [Herpetosiphonaceae bacterium]